MAVVIETTLGDLTVDLFVEERPRACQNFLKLCKIKYYNFNLFHNIEHDFIAQTGDPTGAGDGGESIWGVLEGPAKRYFQAETLPKIKHSSPGLLSLVSVGDNMVGSQFFFTLGEDLFSLDGYHCVIGEVTEGFEILRKLNEAIVDEKFRPYQDIRITHTVVLEDPFDDPKGLRAPSRSPSPTPERLKNGRIGADEDIYDTEGKTEKEIQEMLAEREAKARATILEIVGDLPDADIAPPENVLFVCKLNPVTTDDDLEIIFSRFGKIKSCEVIRDKYTGDSLQYAFIEFEDKKACETAYFKMDNVLIDDRRIHVDFSQSVAKVKWRGKGRGVVHENPGGNGKLDFDNLRSSKNDRRRSPQPKRKSQSPGKQFSRNHRRRDDYSKSRTENRDRSRDQRRMRSRSSDKHRTRHRYEERRNQRSDYSEYRKNRKYENEELKVSEKRRVEEISKYKSKDESRKRDQKSPSKDRHSRKNKKKRYSSTSTNSSSESSSEKRKQKKSKKDKKKKKSKRRTPSSSSSTSSSSD